MMTRTYNTTSTRRAAFTLLEMLIAMAITLLLMAALGRGFAFIGETIRDSRTQVELSNELRDVANRMQRDLARCTVSLRPNVSPNETAGYFVYYEGPVTDATSSLFRAVDAEIPVPDSRYGDFDDYLAFTAVASGDNWFTGKVPAFVLEQKAAELAGNAYTPGPNAWEPVVIRSKYAEIIYFASPEYVSASLPTTPQYIGSDIAAGESGLPSNLRLHRRVLLIRPDLNLSSGFIQSRSGGGVNYMRADSWPSGGSDTLAPQAVPGDAWLYGMAGVHQQCDLSLRRVLDANGRPTQNVAANTLEDLSKPHNRFAHVRVPASALQVTGGVNVTSMPALALTGPAAVLDTPSLADGARIAPPRNVGSDTSPVITPMMLSGFLRPEFVLGYDGNHPSNASHAWGTQRIGEDVIATGVLGFDVKIYDRTAPIVTTSLGQVIDSSSASFREAMREVAAGSHQMLMRGDFVDLMYPVLAGGSMRGWQQRRFDRLTPASLTDGVVAVSALQSEFSGIAQGGNAGNSYHSSLYKSGKIVVNSAGQIRLFQPTFDTFTYHYERDGYLQNSSGADGAGTRWHLGVPSGANFDQAADGLSNITSPYGADNLLERETSPPFLSHPRAVQVSIRVENPLNRQLRQVTVVHRSSN